MMQLLIALEMEASSLNNYEEVKLSEILLKINPWADMVRLARTGGEANAISIRIARANSKNDKIAFFVDITDGMIGI